MARGYLQRHWFPYFSRFLPLNTGVRRIQVDLKEKLCFSALRGGERESAVMSVLS